VIFAVLMQGTHSLLLLAKMQFQVLVERSREVPVPVRQRQQSRA
jgi:hypothetical protein